MSRMEGKVALVTGGGSGIGRSVALGFAREGAKVVVADVIAEGGEATANLVKNAGGIGVFVKCDVSESNQVKTMIDMAVETFGRLDFAANNAGINGEMAGTVDCTEDNWERVIGIDLKGIWLCMKYEIPQMLKHGGGSIVNTSSIAGLVNAGTPPYSAAKHGVLGLTKTAAVEFAQQGVRINAVCPGVIHTPMTQPLFEQMPDKMNQMMSAIPMARFGQPENIADAIVWLCGDGASYITGTALSIDGGYVIQ